MSTQREFAEAFALPPAERLQLVEDLWDSIALETESSPIPDSQLEEVQRRKARFLANPSSGRTWEKVRGYPKSRADVTQGKSDG